MNSKLTDKQFLLELADKLDTVDYNENDCMRMTRELVEIISQKLRDIGNRMVEK